MGEIQRRKKDHILGAMDTQSAVSAVDAGFGDYRFEHNALPEMDFTEIDTSINFLGRELKIPLIISPLTGENEGEERINRNLAGIAHDFGLGMSVGSQRIAFEDSSYENSFKIRRYAPNVLLFANLGAVQLNYGYSVDECKRAIDMIEADAIVLHLNPMQEVFQLDGNVKFSGLLKKIEKICAALKYPVIVKEVGYGISASVAEKLQSAGVYAVDVAGAGSVSWSNIESKRSSDIVVKKAAEAFSDWGNPTVECIKAVNEIRKKMKIIASGGVKNGVDMAKSIALGADVCANAFNFLHTIMISRSDCENYVESLSLELKTAMFCAGCRNIQELKKVKLLKKNN
ncbi:MAG: type 2 isopentenyl-diphosphate Delta-isomerase [Holosporaceae bacterium]|jgi:isopentenyl-diphosphate delta-isomerase|nr:type 2 isopentenyl-diphosphate Delta-isomerase [Holosporaceae bacterium]